MHPAASVIFFTVSSGAGYGLLAFAGVAAALGALEGHQAMALAMLVLAGLAITAGLLSSTFHLGHPERAWRALSQWRSSWLSREAVAALLTYIPTAALFLLLAFGQTAGGTVALAGLLAAAGAAVTVWCTGKIYAVLKPVPSWHSGWTVAAYMAFAAASGAILFLALVVIAGARPLLQGSVVFALAALLAAMWVKQRWLARALAAPMPSVAAAIGLAGRGTARPFEPPHTGTNFLLEEMGFRIGRKHAARLSLVMWVAGFVVPGLLIAVVPFAPWLAVPAALSMLAGIAVERWLFFATATHTVTLYYR